MIVKMKEYCLSFPPPTRGQELPWLVHPCGPLVWSGCVSEEMDGGMFPYGFSLFLSAVHLLNYHPHIISSDMSVHIIPILKNWFICQLFVEL